MQTFHGLQDNEPDLDLDITAPGVANLDSTQDRWAALPRGENVSMPNTTSYLDLSIPNLPTSNGPFPLPTAPEQTEPALPDGEDDQVFSEEVQPALSGFGPTANFSQASAAAPFPPPAVIPPQATFPTSDPAIINPAGANTISPLDTHVDREASSRGAYPGFSSDGDFHPAGSFNFNGFANAIDGEQLPPKRRHDSAQVSSDTSSPSTTQHTPARRRKSENVEPGSARAIYLEKNRKAASKCRIKQKKQQEELVETARHVERKNKALKAEVENLKGGVRELMEIVGQHTDCPDTRLKTYVQREADRLAAGSSLSPIHGSNSSKKSASPPE